MNDNTLDSIFKNTFTTPTVEEEGNWDELEVRLSKKMFYKFSWNRFNVYYMGMVYTCLLSSSVLLVTQFVNSSTNKEANGLQNQVAVAYPDSAATNTEVSQEKGNQKQIQASAFTKGKKDAILQDDSSTLGSETTIKDTTKNTLHTPSTETSTTAVVSAPVVIKRKKTFYLTPPRDTIITIDTIKVKKGRKK